MKTHRTVYLIWSSQQFICHLTVRFYGCRTKLPLQADWNRSSCLWTNRQGNDYFICQMGLVLCFSIPSLNCGFTDVFQWGWFSIWNTTCINFCTVCLNFSFSATFYRSLRSTHGIYRPKSSAKGTSMFHLMRKPHYKTVHSYLLPFLRALKCYRYQKKGKSNCFLPSHTQERCWQPLKESLVDQRRVEKDWQHSMKFFNGSWRRTACTIVKIPLLKYLYFS